MKWLMRYAGIVALVLAVISLEAMARDLDQDEVLRLRQDGVIQPLESLMQEALGVTPGAPAGGRAGRGRRRVCLRGGAAHPRRRRA